MASLEAAEVDRYLERVDLDPEEVRGAERDVETLARLQSAHVRTVPFENLSIVGDPFGEDAGEGVTLDLQHLYRKVVERRRGGYCFELNGLFTALLDALGFDVHRAAAIMLSSDGDHSVPANHHVVIVRLDRRYVVDVGMGAPQMRRPTPLSGEAAPADEVGVSWRVVPTDRPLYECRTEYRRAEDGWQERYLLDPTPRELSYFESSCEYLASAPESPFTGQVFVRLADAGGWLELGPETFARVEGGERTERELGPGEWYEVLEGEFGLSPPG